MGPLCVCDLCSLFLLLCYLFSSYGTQINVEDLQMQFDKNAYHFKWKMIKLY